jgi:hypothetical protein
VEGGVFRCGPELLARSVVDARWGVLGLNAGLKPGAYIGIEAYDARCGVAEGGRDA